MPTPTDTASDSPAKTLMDRLYGDPVTTLTLRLRNASAAYYNTGAPVMEDWEYDQLRDELERLAPEHPFLSEVGAPAAAGRRKVRHRIPMLSLNKATTRAELVAWLGRWSKPGMGLVLEPKIDGASVELQYRNGALVEAVTRGDGAVGEDVMVAVRKMGSVPRVISIGGDVSVRGEVVLLLEDWEKVDPARSKNPRNCGNGVLRRDDGAGAEHLTFLAFDAMFGDGSDVRNNVRTETRKTQTMQELGFTAPFWYPDGAVDGRAESGGQWTELEGDHAADADRILHLLGWWSATRSRLGYAIDGIVLKPDDLQVARDLGITSGRPLGHLAFKWTAAPTSTTLLDVRYTVGHSGLISPVAVLEPVDIMGAEISSALLNNFEEIRRLDIQIGDTVHVIRAGEIIPVIVGRTPAVPRFRCSGCGVEGTEAEIAAAHAPQRTL